MSSTCSLQASRQAQMQSCGFLLSWQAADNIPGLARLFAYPALGLRRHSLARDVPPAASFTLAGARGCCTCAAMLGAGMTGWRGQGGRGGAGPQWRGSPLLSPPRPSTARTRGPPSPLTPSTSASSTSPCTPPSWACATGPHPPPCPSSASTGTAPRLPQAQGARGLLPWHPGLLPRAKSCKAVQGQLPARRGRECSL